MLALPGVAMIGAPALAATAQFAPRGWSDDPFFGKPTIDKDEWRGEGRARHRYVHGQFEGTDTRFAIALPEAAVYQGRFVQFLQGGLGGNELTGYGRGSHNLAFAQGGYYVESNQGHIGNDMSGLRGDGTIRDWRASAQTARFARTLSEAMYGRPPQHGYVMGGSGGGMRSIDCIEHEPEIWAGAVPFMINREGLTAFDWSLTAWASVMLQASLPAVARASLEGIDPLTVLKTDAERSALTTLYRAGFPRRAEDQLGPNPLWILGMQMAVAQDPRYFVDFWQVAGFEGKDGAPEIKALTVDAAVEVEAVLTGDDLAGLAATDPDAEITGAAMRAGFVGKAPAGIRIKGDVPLNRLLGSSLVFETGEAKGRRILCTGAVGGALTSTLDAKGFAGIQPGDKLTINNRVLLAFLFFHRHVVDPRYPGMQQFFEGGKPRYLQRQIDFDRFVVPRATFRGKMILLQHLVDREALPTCAEPFIQGVHKNLGAKADDQFRVWWMDNAQHGVPQDARNRYIDYRGADSQALADVIAWVEQGKAPPQSTRYHFDEMNQVVVPAGAAARRGVQPTIQFTANGAASANAKVGEAVKLQARIDAPPGAGKVVAVAFDFDGSGNFAASHEMPGPAKASYTAQTSHVFDKPGRYAVSVRAESERQGRRDGYLVQNLARVLVIVA